MRLGYYMGYAPPGTNPLELIELAQEAERLGFDSAWAAEGEAVLRAARGEGAREAWVVQPGREPMRFRFHNVPGPRAAETEGPAAADLGFGAGRPR